jgi:hypothetical protein
MAENLPRQYHGVLRAVWWKVGESRAWWVLDDSGPVDGPHASAEAAWDRVVEIDDADAERWTSEFLKSRKIFHRRTPP